MVALTKDQMDQDEQDYKRALNGLVSEAIFGANNGQYEQESQLSSLANQLRDVAESYELQTTVKGKTHIRVVHDELLSGIAVRLGRAIPEELMERLDYERFLIAMSPDRKRNHPH